MVVLLFVIVPTESGALLDETCIAATYLAGNYDVIGWQLRLQLGLRLRLHKHSLFYITTVHFRIVTIYTPQPLESGVIAYEVPNHLRASSFPL